MPRWIHHRTQISCSCEATAQANLQQTLPFYYRGEHNTEFHLSEVINNALIFVPVGIYLKLLFERLSFVGIVALSGTISLLFEIFQYLLALGRFDITDLMTNTLGGMIGVGVVLAVHGLFDDKDKADTLIAALLNTPVALTVAVVGLLIALN